MFFDWLFYNMTISPRIVALQAMGMGQPVAYAPPGGQFMVHQQWLAMQAMALQGGQPVVAGMTPQPYSPAHVTAQGHGKGKADGEDQWGHWGMQPSVSTPSGRQKGKKGRKERDHKAGSKGHNRGCVQEKGRGKGKGQHSQKGVPNAYQNSETEAAMQERDAYMYAAYGSIKDVVGKVYTLSKDQLGCRFLQKMLGDDNDEKADGSKEMIDGKAACDIIFDEIYGHLGELMTDPFGNYLCQKLMVRCKPEQRRAIVESMAPDLVQISCDIHGTRAVQRLISILAKGCDHQVDLGLVINAMRAHVVDLIRNLNGNHVVQACLHNLTSEANQFIYDAVSQNCVSVATHRHGCCVLQRCIDFANQSQRGALVSEIVNNALTLVQDPFGNYVVQYVLKLKDAELFASVWQKLKGSVAELSKQKFSSNVIEKMLAMPYPETFEDIVTELAEPSRILELLQDGYANYVIQKALAVDHPVNAYLVEQIRPHLSSLRNTPYGKKLTSKIQKKVAKGENR